MKKALKNIVLFGALFIGALCFALLGFIADSILAEMFPWSAP